MHYEIDEDARNVRLTDAGARIAEKALGGIDLYTDEHLDTLTRLNVALHAHALLQRDVDYIVPDGKVQLIDESRGRVASLQRWPDGLHAAVEAKEGLAASDSGEILDSITIQSLVSRYPTVCGMTGTAVAVGEQLREFYELEVAVIPPNRPCVREDEPDRLYATVQQKEDALAELVITAHETGRPVLIGTLDVAESERVARRLHRADVECVVLNAKNDAAGGRDRGRGGQPRRDHGVHPDGRPRHRHPARRHRRPSRSRRDAGLRPRCQTEQRDRTESVRRPRYRAARRR